MSENVSKQEFLGLQKEVAALRAELAALSARMGSGEMDEDVIAAIAAALAAYFGKKPKIRLVRRISEDSDAWRTNSRVVLAARRQMPRVRGW